YVGYDPTTEELRRDYDAIIITVGALAGRDLHLPGRELNGIHLAMEYLVQQNRRVAGLPVKAAPISARDKRVIILGGGDTSADCLGNAHRECPTSVNVFTHGPKPPDKPDPLTWPDWPLILQTYPVHEEGGERRWSVAITGFSGENGQVKRMHCIRTERTPEGRTNPLPGTDFEIEADLVLLAIGFTGPVRDRFLEDLNVGYTERGGILATEGFATNVPSVFVAGDAKRGADLIVTAIAEGRKAARQADVYLMNRSLLPG
ncbi:MAG: FAD-dependent oxidoreductase, partial [Rubrobacter sp.]|nr:FAD-dependent oxidoreductase [Rubrobacter sp.]